MEKNYEYLQFRAAVGGGGECTVRSVISTVHRFINYKFDICSFVAFQAFLRRLKKSLSAGNGYSPFVQPAQMGNVNIASAGHSGFHIA